MKRALLVLLGLVLIVAAAWILLRADGSLPPLPKPHQDEPSHTETKPTQAAPSRREATQAPQTPDRVEPDIDAASRAKLEAVLQEHEEDEIRPESKAKLEAILPSEGGTNSPEQP